jgi:hypothetical protein
MASPVVKKPAERPLRMPVTVGLKAEFDGRSYCSVGRLTTTELVKHCYWWVGEEIKSWHRINVSRVANLLAIPIGRATSQGRPIMWSPRPELMQDRRRVGGRRIRSTDR